MSAITSFLLSFALLEDEPAATARVNEWLAQQELPTLVATWRQRDCYGGAKHMEVPLYAGTINHMPMDEFLAFLPTIPWEFPESVQVMVFGPWDEKWRLVEPCVPETLHRTERSP